ncbi:MAG: sugar nucleotide-binding protein [Gemmiger sp.]|nr:sugar nucleotide-binding protein [Gemmiger sp.]
MQQQPVNTAGSTAIRQGEDLLVGSTGFVGGNLAAAHTFGRAVHGSNVAESYGTAPALCVYAGVPAAMFLANADPAADLAVMAAARQNLQQIAPRRLVLISTIAVYADSRGRDESTPPTPDGLPAYGKNRLTLEHWVRQDFPDALIVRLPALYGRGLKKNFLYDLKTITPAMLKPEVYATLAAQSPLVAAGYTLAENGFYKRNGQGSDAALKEFFAAGSFNALSFTDSRSRYQFYDLARLWQDVTVALAAGLTTLNLTTPPVTAAEVYTAVTGKTGWKNELPRPPFDYDLHSRYAALLGGQNPYLCTRAEELAAICRFMQVGEGPKTPQG